MQLFDNVSLVEICGLQHMLTHPAFAEGARAGSHSLDTNNVKFAL